jgi:hypothetical protein
MGTAGYSGFYPAVFIGEPLEKEGGCLPWSKKRGKAHDTAGIIFKTLA